MGDVDGNNLPDIIAPFGNNTFGLYKAVSDGAVVGDFNGDGELDILDLDQLCGEVAAGTNSDTFDLNADGVVNSDDVLVWVVDIKGSTIGDSNLDGVFNSTDFIVVFTVGEYEDSVANNSTWPKVTGTVMANLIPPIWSLPSRLAASVLLPFPEQYRIKLAQQSP
ncbi:MAG: hypothetical protein R3C28_25375 [Pirellulaceae bacterium]